MNVVTLFHDHNAEIKKLVSTKLDDFRSVCEKEREIVIRVAAANIQNIENTKDLFYKDVTERHEAVQEKENAMLNKWSEITQGLKGEEIYTWTEDDGLTRTTDNKKLYDWVSPSSSVNVYISSPLRPCVICDHLLSISFSFFCTASCRSVTSL